MSNLVQVLENPEIRKAFGTRRAMLMERVDAPGMLGVHMIGGRYTCPLPPGYNEKTEVFYMHGRVIVICPGQKPLVCDFNKGTATPIA